MTGWILRMAWRDSRGSRRRLLVFVSSVVLGVAALVAINSFGVNLRGAVDAQARTLLGADLSIESPAPFPDSVEAVIRDLGGRQSRRISFASMALFLSSGDTRLATVRAVEGEYPWYGAIETDPPDAVATWRTRGGALVDRTLVHQFGVQPGDSVRIGARSYPVMGTLLRTPRESSAVSLFSPRIYIPLDDLDRDLLQRGSRAEYEVYFRFDERRDLEALADSLRPSLRSSRVGIDTVEEVRENWDEALTNLYRFLGLVGFVALLVGSLGVASSVHVYVRQRIETMAVLRCFGARTWPTFGVYLTQAAAIGTAGAVAGALLGVGIQLTLPGLLADVIPVEVEVAVSWTSVLVGVGTGITVTVLFALLPLLAVRDTSPLLALRSTIEEVGGRRPDPVRWGVKALITAGVGAFAVLQAPRPVVGLGYAAGVAVVFLALAALARLLAHVVRRHVPDRFPYLIRQGLANLHRPNNQTLLLMLALGLGTFLIAVLSITESTLLSQIRVAGGENRPNLVFFDIQRDQEEGVGQVVRSSGLPLLERVPVVSMRLAEVAGRRIDAIRADSALRPTWAFTREYRSSYRSGLSASERLVSGEFVGRVAAGTLPVPVSAEREIAADLGVGVGDTLVWNVQGVEIPSVVTSLREVDWRRMQTNFFFVFPEGVLEAAPQFGVVLTRASDAQTSARVQSAVVHAFPNVSAIDLSLVLDVFDAIFSRIAFVIRFMALFSVLTGFFVLSGAVLSSRAQRVEETVLLKTVGASRRQVLAIMLVEYLALGVLAVLTGLLLAVGAGWVVARFVFDVSLSVDPAVLALLAAGVILVVTAIGAATSRGVYNRQALEVLRAET